LDEVQKQNYKDWVMAILALVSLILIIVKDSVDLSPLIDKVLSFSDNTIWMIFIVDYVYGFVKAGKENQRKTFIKKHIIELIAILPFDALLKSVRMMRLIPASRMARMLRFIRVLAYGSRISRMLQRFLATHNFYLVVTLTVLCVALGAVALSFFEEISFAESVWRSFLSANGESGDTPITTQGKVVASFLMLTGAGFTGVLTATIAAFFIDGTGKNAASVNPHIEVIMKQLERFDALSESEIDEIIRILTAMKKNDKSEV
jgi:voltage-gated potassium channel